MSELVMSSESPELSLGQEANVNSLTPSSLFAIKGLESAIEHLDHRRQHQRLTPEVRQFYTEHYQSLGGDPTKLDELF